MARIAGSPSPLRWVAMLLVASTALAGPLDEPKPKTSPSKKAGTSKSKGSSSENSKAKADDGPKTPEQEKKAEEAAKRKDEAFKAAEAYLVLLDKGKFGECWEAMTAEVRKGITRRKWVDSLGKTKGNYATLRGRKLNRIQMRATEFAGKFDEAWVYTDFQTVDGEIGAELLVVVLEGGKNWTVNSFWIGADTSKFPKLPAEEPEPEEGAKAAEPKAKAAPKDEPSPPK